MAWWSLFDTAQRQIKMDANKQATLLALFAAAHDCPLVIERLVQTAGPSLDKCFDNFMCSYVVYVKFYSLLSLFSHDPV